MSAADKLAGSNRLPVLAASIAEHIAAAEKATRRGLEHAIAAGQLLREAKDLVDHHGDWLPWLQANCRLGSRQAQTYMRLAKNRHRLDAIKNESSAHLTIAAAVALVGRPRPERPRGLPGQLDMLGGPEVIRPPPTARSKRDLVAELIARLEVARAVIKDEERHAPRDRNPSRSNRRRRRFCAIAATINAVLAYLREAAS
jgi:DUF3102 family protein